MFSLFVLLVVSQLTLVKGQLACYAHTSMLTNGYANGSEPLFLRRETAISPFFFDIPDDGFYIVNDSSSLLLSCANSNRKINVHYNDSFVFSTSDVLAENDDSTYLFNATCINGEFFKHGQLNDVNSFECNRKNSPRIRAVTDAEQLCQNTQRYQIGFEIPSVFNSFVLVADLCYDLTSSSTLLSKHTIYGQSIRTNATMTMGSRPAFRRDALTAIIQANIDNAYRRDSQAARFNPTYPNSIGDLASQRYFARGHLMPDADGVMRSWRDATYFYMNTVPMVMPMWRFKFCTSYFNKQLKFSVAENQQRKLEKN
jgi:hypothetical protein